MCVYTPFEFIYTHRKETMKRTNIFLEENQIDDVALIADVLQVSSAKLIRDMIDLCLLLIKGEGEAADFEVVRQEMIKKKDGADVSYREVVLQLAHEKAQEYFAFKNNSARITDVMNRLTSLELTTEERWKIVEELMREIVELLRKP